MLYGKTEAVYFVFVVELHQSLAGQQRRRNSRSECWSVGLCEEWVKLMEWRERHCQQCESTPIIRALPLDRDFPELFLLPPSY
jgi:hypothetical protein